MTSNSYKYIDTWTEADLLTLPATESDVYEYKGSSISDDSLGDKISIAASAFWNSGGGVFFAGIDKKGKVDGGISEKIGNQGRRDWVDQQITKTEPRGKYRIKLIYSDSSSSLILANSVVLIIIFEESFTAPHMAFDKKYYVRAGAHSVGAGHFLVEAIRARRIVQTPIIRAMLKRSERKSRIVELMISVLNDASALNVKISFDPLPKALQDYFSDRFPLDIPVIDRLHPFSMELYVWAGSRETFGKDPVKLIIQYEALTGESFSYSQIIDIKNSIDPMTIGNTDLENIAKAVDGVSQKVDYLNSILKAFYESSFPSEDAEDPSTN